MPELITDVEIVHLLCFGYEMYVFFIVFLCRIGTLIEIIGGRKFIVPLIL